VFLIVTLKQRPSGIYLGSQPINPLSLKKQLIICLESLNIYLFLLDFEQRPFCYHSIEAAQRKPIWLAFVDGDLDPRDAVKPSSNVRKDPPRSPLFAPKAGPAGLDKGDSL
jgi:hypothetical protein